MKTAGSPPPESAAPWIEFRVAAPASAEEDLAAALCDAGAVGIHVEEGPSGEGGSACVLLRAFFDRGDPPAGREEIERLLREPWARGARLLGASAVADGRWAERWVASLVPFPVGSRFTVVPNADPENLRPGTLPLAPAAEGERLSLPICPSRAFGTGEHPTTRMCLEAIEALGVSGRSFLDVGTGTGILAMAAAALGARRVVAVDIDLEALRVARANCRLLPAAAAVRFACGGAGCLSGAEFEIVVANLNASALEALGMDLVSLVAPGGALILSGILKEERPAIVDRMRALGAPLSSERSRKGWICTVHGRRDA